MLDDLHTSANLCRIAYAISLPAARRNATVCRTSVSLFIPSASVLMWVVKGVELKDGGSTMSSIGTGTTAALVSSSRPSSPNWACSVGTEKTIGHFCGFQMPVLTRIVPCVENSHINSTQLWTSLLLTHARLCSTRTGCHSRSIIHLYDKNSLKALETAIYTKNFCRAIMPRSHKSFWVSGYGM